MLALQQAGQEGDTRLKRKVQERKAAKFFNEDEGGDQLENSGDERSRAQLLEHSPGSTWHHS